MFLLAASLQPHFVMVCMIWDSGPKANRVRYSLAILDPVQGVTANVPTMLCNVQRK